MSTELHDRMFPVVIRNVGAGVVVFNSPTEGVWNGKDAAYLPLDYFMKKTLENPEHYIIESVGGYRFPITLQTSGGLITFESFFRGVWLDEEVENVTRYPLAYFFKEGYKSVDDPADGVEVIADDTDPNYKECAIEYMPLGVKLVGFKDGDTFVELVMTPNVVEVGRGCINLLVRRDPPLDIVAEANFKRGQIIRYTK